MNNSEILDKIKKLLRLGQSPNRHEAELAIQRAFLLAARYQIDIENVSLEDSDRKIQGLAFRSPSRLSFARKKILNLLCEFFNVNVVFRRRPWWVGTKSELTFIGKPVDIQIARYVYHFLHTACASALREFAQGKRKLSANTKKNFVQGFIYGVAHNLRQAQGNLGPQTEALLLNERARREKFESSTFQNLKPVKAEPDRRNDRASIAGFIQGEKVQIRKPIETNAAGQQLLA